MTPRLVSLGAAAVACASVLLTGACTTDGANSTPDDASSSSTHQWGIHGVDAGDVHMLVLNEPNTALVENIVPLQTRLVDGCVVGVTGADDDPEAVVTLVWPAGAEITDGAVRLDGGETAPLEAEFTISGTLIEDLDVEDDPACDIRTHVMRVDRVHS